MKPAILLMFSIVLLTSNPCFFLSCWFCIPKYENEYDFDIECLQESVRAPITPNDTTVLPSGLSKEECLYPASVCASMTYIVSHKGKHLNFTTRSCASWNTGIGSSGTKCIKKDIADEDFIGSGEVCFCKTDLCNGKNNISYVEKQQMKRDDSTKLIDKPEAVKREADTIEKGVNEMQGTTHELRDAA